MTFGGGIALDKYNGERTLSSLIDFVTKQSGRDDDKVAANTDEEDQKKNKVIVPSLSLYLVSVSFVILVYSVIK